MKQRKLLPLMAMTLVLTIVACGGNKSDDGPSDGEMQGHFDHEVKIKFVNTYGQKYQPQLQNFVDTFNEIEPNVKINLDEGWISGNYDSIHTQTISDFATGEYGDLVICYPDHVVDYIDYGKAIKLDPYMENEDYGWTETEREDMVETYISEGQEFALPGTYCLPFSKSTEAMFYNQERLLDSALVTYLSNKGISMNKAYLESLTWEELFGNLCPALEQYEEDNPRDPLIIRNEGDINAYVAYDSTDNLFITLAEQYGFGYTSVDEYGEAHLDFNNDNNKGLAKTFADAAKKGYLRSPSVIGKSYGSDYFKKKNVLFSIGSTAGVINQAGDFAAGVTRIPQAAGKEAKIISQGPSICILDHSDPERILASWLFYKHMVNTKNTAKWATTVGYLPVRQSAFTSEIYMDYCSIEGKEEKSPELLTALNALYSTSVINNVFTSVPFKGSSSARTQVGAMMTNILTDAVKGVTIDDTYINSAFDTAINNILKDM